MATARALVFTVVLLNGPASRAVGNNANDLVLVTLDNSLGLIVEGDVRDSEFGNTERARHKGTRNGKSNKEGSNLDTFRPLEDVYDGRINKHCRDDHERHTKLEFHADIVTAKAAELINTRTPVAYAPP